MTPELSETRRIIAIGDIHGCLLSLKKLIERVHPEHDDQLVFLGDLIDRGNLSKAVIDYLIDLQTRFTCHFIMGNHELMYLEYREKQNKLRWPNNRILKIVRSRNRPENFTLSEKHLAFLHTFRFFIETENYFFTHGGLDPELSVKDNLRYYQQEEFCWQRVHMRTTFRDSPFDKWEKTIVCAHTAITNPIMTDRLIAIDTGCVYKEKSGFGKLTAVILPERHLVQVQNCD
ncbi:metallophosphoesterase family protein [Chlorobium sp. KB01]|uniref:metallophosphoesterase family protein n=1 Tax=Chlorobium sp. KB01 TaxID=1917528 RepID=UPI0009773CCC|nr:metallophosphoesterase family protein [Chlorobium sp. KB01]